MAIVDDFEVQNDKDVRYIGAAHEASGAGYYTVLEFHQWLQGLADDASASGDDFMDITRDTPTDKSYETIITLINGYNIDDTASEHLYQGSIIQDDGDEIYDGITILAAEGCHVEIVQNGAIITNDFWNSTPDGESTEGLNRDVANGISARFMVKVRTSGADIDGRKILCQTREWGKTYSAFKINGTGRGPNPAALLYVDDPNNTTAVGTVAGWTTITNLSEGYNGIDVNNDSTDEYYYSEWDRDTYTINQFYERMKWLSRRGTSSTLYGLNGELFRGISHEVAYSSLTGTFDDSNPVSWSGAATGTGQIIADNGSNKMWVQILTGSAPASTCSLSQTVPDAASATAGTVTERQLPDTINLPFCGASTGTALTGAYGFGIEALDLSASDKVYDLTNTLRQAPNYVIFTVGGLTISEDYVLVGPKGTGDEFDFNQLLLNTTLNGATETAVVVTTSIPADTPASGTLRIELDNGKIRKQAYTSWAGSTFTIASSDYIDPNDATAGNDVMISYIDKLATAASETFTAVYSSDRDLRVRVRDGGTTPIKTFETNAVLGSAGGSVTAIRNSDA
jgi:hypothetical protein